MQNSRQTSSVVLAVLLSISGAEARTPRNQMASKRVYTPPGMDMDIAESLIFYAPLNTGLAAFGVGPTTPTFTRATDSWYISPTTGFITRATSGEARFETNGFLSEQAGTNIALYSEQHDNIVWTALLGTVTADSSAAPDNVNSADTFTATSNGATLLQIVTIGAASRFYSTYIKRKTGSGGVSITINAGTTWTAIAFTGTEPNGYTRVSVSNSPTNPTIGIKLATSGDEIDIWGDQLESASGLTTTGSSYITTSGSSATRDKDQLTYTSAKNLPGAGLSGSFYCVGTSKQTTGAGTGKVFIDTRTSSSTNGCSIDVSSSSHFGYRVNTSSTQASITGASTFTVDTPVRTAVTFSTNNVNGYYNKSLDGTPDTVATMPTHTGISIGQNGNAANQNIGNVRNIMIFSRALTKVEVSRLY